MKAGQPHEGRRCKATNRQGRRCAKAPILGGEVCRLHGGAAPQVEAKAKERLLIEAVMTEFAEAALDKSRVLAEVGCIAYSRPGNLYDEQGAMLSPKRMPEHVAATVASLEVLKRNVTTGDGKIDDVLKVRLWDKPKMLELLAKHHGLAVERLEVSGSISLVERLTAGRERVAKARKPNGKANG